MKTKKISRLSLNKQTVASLSNMTQVKGGFSEQCDSGLHTMMGCTSQFCQISLENKFDPRTWVINPGFEMKFELRTRFEFDYRITGPRR